MRLAEKTLHRSEQVLDTIDGPYLVYNFGGKDNTCEEHTLAKPPVEVQRNAVVTAGIAFDRLTRIVERESGGTEMALGLLDHAAAALSTATDALRDGGATDAGSEPPHPPSVARSDPQHRGFVEAVPVAQVRVHVSGEDDRLADPVPPGGGGMTTMTLVSAARVPVAVDEDFLDGRELSPVPVEDASLFLEGAARSRVPALVLLVLHLPVNGAVFVSALPRVARNGELVPVATTMRDSSRLLMARSLKALRQASAPFHHRQISSRASSRVRNTRGRMPGWWRRTLTAPRSVEL